MRFRVTHCIVPIYMEVNLIHFVLSLGFEPLDLESIISPSENREKDLLQHYEKV